MKLPDSIDSYIRTCLPKMEGWCPPDKATSIAVDILNHQPEVCVEIGVFAGRSLLAAALALKENGRGVIYGIDPWTPDASSEGFVEGDANRVWWGKLDHNVIMQQFLDYIALLGVQDSIRVVRKTNREALPEITLVSPIDWLHIDGNHSVELARYDVENYVPLVRSGGRIWFDDVDWGSTASALSLMDNYAQWDVQVGNCARFIRK